MPDDEESKADFIARDNNIPFYPQKPKGFLRMMSDGQSDGHKRIDKMVTGFDLLQHNQPLQKHWVRRLIAYIIDFIISFVAAIIISLPFALAFAPYMFVSFPFWAGLIQVFYSAIFEYMSRQTVGKMLLDLEVEGMRGGLDLSETLIRNFSKIHGLFLLLDWIVGMATEGDPRQRFLDRISESTVTSTAEPRHFEDFLMGDERREEPRPPNQGPRGHSNQPSQKQGWGYKEDQSGSRGPPPQDQDGRGGSEAGDQFEIKTCRECGGRLKDIGDGKYRCTQCGRIQ